MFVELLSAITLAKRIWNARAYSNFLCAIWEKVLQFCMCATQCGKTKNSLSFDRNFVKTAMYLTAVRSKKLSVDLMEFLRNDCESTFLQFPYCVLLWKHKKMHFFKKFRIQLLLEITLREKKNTKYHFLQEIWGTLFSLLIKVFRKKT